MVKVSWRTSVGSEQRTKFLKGQ